MELSTMAVLLKNLTARTPNMEDLAALSELVRLCEKSEDSMAGSTPEELLSELQRPDFHLANDAWVIVTTRGQIVGFACVWHEHHVRISTAIFLFQLVSILSQGFIVTFSLIRFDFAQ